jgi:outer membrane protein OmpA-like peptidoglycan-associated protein
MITCVVWLLASCAGYQEVKTEPIPMTENPAEHVNILDRDLSNARKNQFNVLAPVSFAESEKYLNNAKRALERGGEIAEIFENVSRGKAELEKAEKTVRTVKTVLSDAIESRSLARAAGATQFEEEYAVIEEDFLFLTEAVEKNNSEWAKLNQKRVSDGFRQLELQAIKEKTLGEVRELLRLAEKAGANKMVPKTFGEAQQKLRDADTYISEQRYQTEEIRKKADEALFQAQRLSKIMQLSEKMKDMKPEQISLFIEGILQQITEKLSATDMRNEAFDLQVENIHGSIKALQDDRQFMVEKARAQQEQIEEMTKNHNAVIEDMSRHLAELQGETRQEQAVKKRLEAEKRAVEERLAAERQFNQLYNEVQDYFEPDEAEVYKQGYQLVIRLKDMRFPVGKAVLMPENYQLLSKIQRAIRTFGEPDVIIEGHTDSTGSEAMNEHLSQKRADAVLEYLLENKTLTADKFLAVGYGSQKPLASNETPEGRAINRRIDVIIKPKVIEEASVGSS